MCVCICTISEFKPFSPFYYSEVPSPDDAHSILIEESGNPFIRKYSYYLTDFLVKTKILDTNSLNRVHWINREQFAVVKNSGVSVYCYVEHFSGLNSCNKRYVEKLKNILEKNYEKDNIDKNLIIAVIQGNTNAVNKLLKNGVNINYRTHFYNTPLIKAAEAGHVDIVKILLKRGADRNAENWQGETAMTVATRHGYLEIMQLLNQRNIE